MPIFSVSISKWTISIFTTALTLCFNKQIKTQDAMTPTYNTIVCWLHKANPHKNTPMYTIWKKKIRLL